MSSFCKRTHNTHTQTHTYTASCMEPTLQALPGAQAAATSTRPELRRGVLMVLPSGMTVLDVAVIHPVASSYVQAVQTVGSAAAV